MATMVAGGPVLESLHSEMEGGGGYKFQKLSTKAKKQVVLKRHATFS